MNTYVFLLSILRIHVEYPLVVDAVNCGAILTDSSGWFSSPDIDDDGQYELYAECTWVVRVPENKILHIQFQTFDVEDSLMCQYDYLRIRDGNTKVGHYCGDVIPPDFISTARLVFVDFHADQYITRKGFNATYKELDDPTCGYRTWSISDKFGTFDTDLHEDCTWTISEQKHVPAIQIYVAKYNVSLNADCETNFLEIFNDKTILGKYCGDTQIPIITSMSTVVHVRLRSQGNAEFLLYFCTTDENGEWGGLLTGMTGQFIATDKDYNGLYDHFVNTVWNMVAKDGFFIKLYIFDIHIHTASGACDTDSLKIYDGAFEPGTEIDSICGYTTPSRLLLSRTDVFYAHFLTNGYYSGGGFNATYEQIPESERPPTTIKTTTEVPTNTPMVEKLWSGYTRRLNENSIDNETYTRESSVEATRTSVEATTTSMVNTPSKGPATSSYITSRVTYTAETATSTEGNGACFVAVSYVIIAFGLFCFSARTFY